MKLITITPNPPSPDFDLFSYQRWERQQKKAKLRWIVGLSLGAIIALTILRIVLK